jgi:glycine cleavage system H protein
MLRGRKVILRPYDEGFTDEEVSRHYRWSRDAEVLRLSGGLPTELGLAEFVEQFRQERIKPSSTRRVFAILTRQGELIGRIGYFQIDKWRRQAELGIVIGEKEYWGQGYGRDAVETLLRHIFRTANLRRIYLFTYIENVRAQRCFARCGFRRHEPRKWLTIDLTQHEGIEMEITREEFQRLQVSHHERKNLMNPKDCKYTKDHEWARIESDGAVVGITDYAQHQLGDIVYVDLPKVGTTIEQFKPFGVIESVKAASDLYAPVSGQVIAANEALASSPELVNKDPYGAAWMIKVKPSNTSELDKLMTADEYEAYLKTLE